MAECAWCHEAFVPGDATVTMPYAGGPDEPSFLRFHRDCELRQIIGSLAHQRRECSCFVRGSTCTDPPQMSLREAARAAVEEWRRQTGWKP